MTIALTFGLLILGLSTSLPMFIVMTGTAFVVLWMTSPIPLSILPQRVFAGIESFTLLAIPLFILAANIMARGGLSERMVKFATVLTGHLPGGLGITVVVTCLFFSAVTGSSASTIVAVGGILYPALLANGYSERFSLGVVTSSALIGMIIPPSNAMIVYGAVANVSIGALFLSGVGAGLVFAAMYAAYCVFWAIRNNVPRSPRASLREILVACREVIWALGMPAVILGGLYGGIFTATEAAAVAVVYAAFVGIVIYRKLDARTLWDVAVDSGLTSARILIIVGAASAFSWLLTVTGTTQTIASPLAAVKDSPTQVLLYANVLHLVAGMFVDVYSNILILVPILLGPLMAAGVGGVHYGIITTVNSDIGNITPPLGLNLFVSSGTFNKSYLTIVVAVLPWLVLAIISLMIVTYIPQISLWLPQQLYPGVR
jgi:C4-dicarboxylate transporter DctM subunit